MSERVLNSRIIHKHDVEVNWLKAVNFIPKQGEIIVYDRDDTYNYERIKIGDGNTLVSALPFTAVNMVYVGPTQPTDPNVKVWINTAEEGTGIIPVLPRITTISLPAANWNGSAAPYSQTVSINTATSATKIDLQPTVAQITSLQNDDVALMAENTNGTVKIYSFGGKPSSDMTMQVLLTEVSYV